MSTRSTTALTWVLRLVGAALLAWLLATQVQWNDQVVLQSGAVISCEVGSVDEHTVYVPGGFRYAPDDALASFTIPLTQVATRTYGGDDVPDVTYGARTLLRRLADSQSTVVLVLFILTLLVVFTGLRWKLLIRGVGIAMPFPRAVRLTFIGGFFNMAVPGSTGGDIVKAWYARKDAKSRYPEMEGVGTKAILSVFVDRFVGLFGLVVLASGVLLLAVRGEAFEVPRLVVLAVLAVGIAGGIIVISKPVRRALGLAWIMRRLPFQGILQELRTAASLYRNHRRTLLAALGISLFNHAGNALSCWLLAQALGIEGITLGTAMALVPLANLLSAVPLLPGGWGVGELAFAYFFGLVGVPPTEAIGLSVMFRLAVLGVNLPGGLLWILWKGHPSTETISADMESATALAADDSTPKE